MKNTSIKTEYSVGMSYYGLREQCVRCIYRVRRETRQSYMIQMLLLFFYDECTIAYLNRNSTCLIARLMNEHVPLRVIFYLRYFMPADFMNRQMGYSKRCF